MIVCRKMLDARAHARGLHARYKRFAKLARKQRIFRIILEVATAERMAFDVDRRREQ